MYPYCNLQLPRALLRYSEYFFLTSSSSMTMVTPSYMDTLKRVWKNGGTSPVRTENTIVPSFILSEMIEVFILSANPV